MSTKRNKLVGRQLNLSVEVWDYKPVPEKTIVALLDRADPTLEPQSLTGFDCSIFLAVQYILNSVL